MYLRTAQIISLFSSLYPPLVSITYLTPTVPPPHPSPFCGCREWDLSRHSTVATGTSDQRQSIIFRAWSSYELLINGSFVSPCVVYWGNKSLLLLSELIEDSSWNVNFVSILSSRNICHIPEYPLASRAAPGGGSSLSFPDNTSGW